LGQGLEGRISWNDDPKGWQYGVCLYHPPFAPSVCEVHARWRRGLGQGLPAQSGAYKESTEFRPTSIAFAPNGHFYVADGYGKHWVHHYDAKAEYVGSWGGEGTEPGKFKTPHGIWVDTRGSTPAVLVADRANHRLQWFTLDGKYLKMMDQNCDCRADSISGEMI
jgi:hypothetical protein